MPSLNGPIEDFVAYAGTLSGYEKGESQVFLERLFRAFGHKGYKEAGASLEARVRKRGKTSFADLLWSPRLLLEMKSRGEDLQEHYRQAFEYWLHATPRRPRYVVLCNFDEFWIYDFDEQLDDPKEKVPLANLAARSAAFGFMLPDEKEPDSRTTELQ